MQALLDGLRAQGVAFTHVTLHVGAGTFLPVKVEDVTTHRMHAEWGQVSDTAAAEIAATRAAGGRVIPVGTTALRLIESAARGGAIAPWEGETDIFIYPGFRFRVTDALMTNFHLPRSTLMMLVSALMGRERIARIYAHAVRERLPLLFLWRRVAADPAGAGSGKPGTAIVIDIDPAAPAAMRHPRACQPEARSKAETPDATSPVERLGPACWGSCC